MAPLHSLIARVPSISTTQKGPVVNLVSWIAMTTMCLAVVTVLVSKLIVLRRLVWTDSIIIAAMLSSIGFAVVINNQVSHGLGSKVSTISNGDYDGFQKAEYAWNILYIVSLSLAKLSTLSLLLALAPSKRYRIPMLAVGSVVVLWALSSSLASAFQCNFPHSYLITTNVCFDQTAFWIATGIVDILTDVAIMGMPIYLVYNLQLPRQKKVAVCFAFSFRVGAVGCTIWRLCEVHVLFNRRSDITFHSWLPTIATILEVFAGVFAACVPHLRPFMDSIQAGYLSGMIQDSDGRFGYGNDSYLMGKMAQSKLASQVRSQALKSDFDAKAEAEAEADTYVRNDPRHGGGGGGDDDGSFDLPRQGARVGIGRAITSSNRVVANGRVSAASKAEKENLGPALTTRARARARSESIASDGGGSHGSDGSKAMIIKTTKEWTVSYQDV
ncbi:hypothetical protein A1O1_05836 [Capronia coronata CBS 617.96]|uniref:Rhodopsin domain-containing protein n=1 Tax=Capronia coronata CBS 617.96 TaxID=1182541 RepID=W9XY70_9EURO|nr:uncharacterized protein A1O1_05836 [Capronia coronata CBS 617.96]EXJ85472.1 hypothetical protein A1O1_05836 [Capronia coronata CBS 617.96]